MDLRNSALIVVVYFVLAVTVALLVFVGYHVYIRPDMESHIPSHLAETRPSRSTLSANSARSPADYRSQRRQAFEDALQKIEELKGLLDRKTTLLQEKSGLLDKRTAEYAVLREEANQYFSLMLEMAARESGNGSTTSSPEQEERTASSLAEMERLEDELVKSDAADETLEAALDETTWELEQAYAEMADAELSAIVESQMTIQSTAASVLTEIGAPAAAPLAEALADERAEVRRWAAVVLGQMGAGALAATDALATATRDADPGVRQAAREALARIEDDF